MLRRNADITVAWHYRRSLAGLGVPNALAEGTA